MLTKIEHLNITVPDIDAAIRFLKIVAPDFMVRKDSKPIDSYRWVHIGNDDCYLALQEAHLDVTPKKQRLSYKNFGVNHIGLVVSNVDEIEERLITSGYKKGIDTRIEQHRKRIYYYDNADFEWELVEYTSDKPEEMYLYE